MADTKISQLPAATTPTGAEVVPVLQGGDNKRSTALALAAPAVTAHEAAADPHPQYQTQAEGDARYATTAQGAKADTAVQPAGLSGYLTSATAATTYQPLDSDLTAIAALSTTSYGRAFLALADAAAGRTALALGTAATTDATAYATTAQGSKADTAVQPAALSSYQPLDSDLTAIAALTTTAFGRALLELVDAAAARTALGLGTAATTAASAYATAAQGTKADTAVQPADLSGYQPLDSDLTSIAALSTTSFGRSLLTQADAAAARTTLGAGTAATQNVGTSPGNVVQLDASGNLPAVNGSQLTGIVTTTDLSYNAATRVIASSTGADATLPLFDASGAGLVPASGGGTTNYLRADGTFAAPPAGASPAGSGSELQFRSSGAAFGAVTGSSVDASGNITIGTRWISSLNGAASAPPAALTGTWFTGGTATTTKPQVLIEPSGATSTAWSTSGTGLGVNAASGFAGNLLDLQVNGTSRLVVNSSFIARQNPDSTATGGNARGAGAVDLASGRTAAGNVASGADSFMAATTNGRATGVRSVAFQNSVASGTDSFAAVNGAEASGASSFAIGVLAKAQAQQSIVLGDGIASADSSIAFGYGTPKASGIRSFALNWGATTPNLGQFGYGFRDYGAQWTMMGLIGQSTGSTAVELLSEGVAGYRAVLPANTTWAGTAMIAARTRNGISNATFQRQVMIKRDGSNNTDLVGTVQTLGTDIKSNADFDATVTITADNTNESLKVEGTAKVGGTVSSITSSGTTCTVTMSANHGLLTGDYVTIAGAAETQYNGTFTITKTGDTTFTYTAATTPSASPATGTLTANITCRWVCKLDLVQITHSA